MFAVPIDYAEFELRLQSSDWLSKFRGEKPARERWQQNYQPLVAEPLVTLIKQAGSLGVTVVYGTTLESFNDATRKSDLVILFAHWKGFEVTSDDLARPGARAEYAERAATSQTPLARWIHQALCPPASRFSLWRRDDRSVRDILAEAMEGKGIEPDKPDAGVDRVYEAELTARTRRRDELDVLFHGLLRSGNQLELFDGMRPKEDVEAAIAPEFRGILDLTICTSAILGDYIGGRRSANVRTVQFPTVQEFAWASRCVGIALQMCLTDGIPYLEARVHAMNIMAIAVREAAREQRLEDGT